MNRKFSLLQQKIEELIRKSGSIDKAIEILDDLVMVQGISNESLQDLIILVVSNYYGLTKSELINPEGNKNADPRMVCYMLFKDPEILDYSIRQIGAVFNRTERPVMRGIEIMRDVIKKPALNIKGYDCYLFVKNYIIKIKQLNYGVKKPEE